MAEVRRLRNLIWSGFFIRKKMEYEDAKMIIITV